MHCLICFVISLSINLVDVMNFYNFAKVKMAKRNKIPDSN